MGYIVSAMTGLGSAVSVVVETIGDAVAKLGDFHEDGFEEVLIKDLDGLAVDLNQLREEKPAG